MSYLTKVRGLFAIGFKTGLAYRFEFFVSLITGPFALLIYYFLWRSIFVYSGEDVINGFTFKAMMAYYVLNMVVSFFTASDVEEWMQYDIVQGELITDLLKPVRHLTSLLYFEVGISSIGMLVDSIPLFVIGILFFDMPSSSLVNLGFFVISLIFAYLIYFFISYIIGLTAFWLNKIDGLHMAKKPIIDFLSGGVLPLTFFPLWAQHNLKYLPFQYVRFVPINIYLGMYTVKETLIYLTISLVWVLALYLLIRLIWKYAMNQFTGVGS